MEETRSSDIVVAAAWAVAILPFALLSLAGLGNGPGLNAGDYAHYLLHAQALAEGRPYGDIGYIFVPEAWGVGPPVQPPSLPLILAPLMALGAPMWVSRLVMLAFATVFVVVAGRYFARVGPWWLGPGVTLMVGVSPSVVWMSSQVLTDLPFAALVWYLIFLYDREGPWTVPRVLAISVLGAVALGMRTAGLVLLPATALAGAFGFRRNGWWPLAPLAIWATIGMAAASGGGVSLAIAGRIPNLGEWMSVLSGHLVAYRIAVSDALLHPFPGDLPNDLYHVTALGFLVVGSLAWIRKRWSSYAVLFTICYVAMLLFVAVRDGRYLVPLLPVVAFGFLNGMRIVSGFLRRRERPDIRPIVVLGTATAIVIGSLFLGPREPAREFLAEQVEVRALFDHLRQDSSKGMRVAFVKPRILTWETGIPAMPTFSASPQVVDSVLRANALTHIVVGDYGISPGQEEVFRQVVEADSARFVREYENEKFELYRIVDAGR